MNSEKWFDWDTSENPESAAASSDRPEDPAASATPTSPDPGTTGAENTSDTGSLFQTQSPIPSSGSAEDYVPLETGELGAPSESGPPGSAEPTLGTEGVPAAAGFEAIEAPASTSGAPPAAPPSDSDPRTLTALRALHVDAVRAPAPVDAARPFHLRITGSLQTFEKERLLELIARENFGIREVDLDLQLEAGRILLPRISEFAAVLVAQTLRGAAVELRLEPSELVAAGAESALDPPTRYGSILQRPGEPATHPAEQIPVTSQPAIPGRGEAEELDVIIATGLIREPEWKAETSDAFSGLVESLKRELRFKAHLKKADALVRFEAKVLNSPWISESECRIQVSALAVRFAGPS